MSDNSERRPRRKFSDEFKADAVALVEESGGQIAKVAKELGIYDSSLGNWVRQAREEAASAPTAGERSEIRELKRELEREYERYKLVDQQVKGLEKLQIQRAEDLDKPAMQQITQLMGLKGVGWQSSWILTMEFFLWRDFKNTKQLGSCAGLTPTPYDSGDSTREQGISKAGNNASAG